MSNTFLRVEEVAEEMEVSKSYAYKIVQRLNRELESMGYLTVAGQVNKQYFIVLIKHSTAKRGCGMAKPIPQPLLSIRR